MKNFEEPGERTFEETTSGTKEFKRKEVVVTNKKIRKVNPPTVDIEKQADLEMITRRIAVTEELLNVSHDILNAAAQFKEICERCERYKKFM